ncbi:MAG: hypothetical protein M1818_006400 [Claussenomyces sp. TS43310]|nr:MAG: hypothetical protein M1818_006400 [Claussenomyces sp. TS43310]
MSPGAHSTSPTADAPKNSIKGFSLFSKPLAQPHAISIKSRASPSSTSSSSLGKRTRPALHEGFDSDEDEERPVRHEAVTAFDAGGAVPKDARAGTQEKLVIPRMKNRDWREGIRHARQGKNLLPPEVQAARNGRNAVTSTAVDVVNAAEDEPKWGLTIPKNIKVDSAESEDIKKSEKPDHVVKVETGEEAIKQALPEKTDDERAIEALMGIEGDKKHPDLVIPAVGTDLDGESLSPPGNEEDAFRRAIRNAPDVSTLEDYERVPVEEFGAALLRGMGWKEGVNKVERPKDVKRRQNLLGLGARELKGAEELGAWVQKSDPRRLGSAGSRGSERRPRANEYRERQQRRRDERDDRYGGGHRRGMDYYQGERTRS